MKTMYNCEICADYDIVDLDEDGNVINVSGCDEHFVTRSKWKWWLKVKAAALYLKMVYVLKIPRKTIYSFKINRCDYAEV